MDAGGRRSRSPYSLPLTPYFFMSPRASALPTHVTSSGNGRRAALAAGVERSPEEYEGRVSLGGASSAVGTRMMTSARLEARPRLDDARTTQGISPRARSRSLGRDDRLRRRSSRLLRLSSSCSCVGVDCSGHAKHLIRATRDVDFGDRRSRSPQSAIRNPHSPHSSM